MKTGYKIFFGTVLFLTFFTNASEHNSFKIVRGGYGDKPLIWFEPKEDVDGNKPVDIAESFLKKVKENDHKKAEIFCIPIQEFDNRPTRKSSLKEGGFEKYIESINKLNLKRITISEYPIKEKSGYWRVKILIKKSGGDEKEQSIYLKIHNDKWKVQETSGWYEAALGKRKPFNL